ncbi:hypothetical protein SAMN03080594_1183, partial [Arenibacter palladensis]
NVMVDGYKSYRRDGLGDLQHITNGTFKNIHAESTIEIFKSSYKFTSLRFLGDLKNVAFENMTLKDNSLTATIYPLDYTNGDNVTLNNVNVITTALDGCFKVSGSNNTIQSSSLVTCN